MTGPPINLTFFFSFSPFPDSGVDVGDADTRRTMTMSRPT